jgi:hypothetical protein
MGARGFIVVITHTKRRPAIRASRNERVNILHSLGPFAAR